MHFMAGRCSRVEQRSFVYMHKPQGKGEKRKEERGKRKEGNEYRNFCKYGLLICWSCNHHQQTIEWKLFYFFFLIYLHKLQPATVSLIQQHYTRHILLHYFLHWQSARASQISSLQVDEIYKIETFIQNTPYWIQM